ncbi:N-acetylmuramic acid 6-phosphate etherase [Elusimicrobium simillimum]|uniref:N-acetylmuramic acid 6-phosphate etherase n=1 Tax=Elusimicrobium simillimum TaxID=3143438 RepID=UPI003C6EF0B2
MKKNPLSQTEMQNKNTAALDKLSPLKIVEVINKEDAATVKAVGKAKKEIAAAIRLAADCFGKGGKIIFIGAGTSGRLGILEAAECPPTFSTDPAQIIGIMAGGKSSVFKAKEGAEDDGPQGVKDILAKAKKGDIVFGVAASGKTPYVIAALKAAKKIKAKTVLVTCNNKGIEKFADVTIYLPTGPEVLQGSTRMKAATATKMTLNIITTGAMTLCGKVYKNLMVDVKASNIKLRGRAQRLVETTAKVPPAKAEKLLKETSYNVKTAIVMGRKNISKSSAEKLLRQNKGFLRKVFNE